MSKKIFKTADASDGFQEETFADELFRTNQELARQSVEREKRAAELLIANAELAFQNIEKENRAAELVIANQELAIQLIEKENRAAELLIANAELAFQNSEKEKRAAELFIANKELAFQNREKEKRAAELLAANKELESFTFISSHDLQEPLRKIQAFSARILDEEYQNLSAKGKYYVERTNVSALHMQTLINDLFAYSRVTVTDKKFVNYDLKAIVGEVKLLLKEELEEKEATIEVRKLCEAVIIPFQFRQLLQNLISNSLKFCNPDVKPHIVIESTILNENAINLKKLGLKSAHHHIRVSDNGIGFDGEFNEKIFQFFQRLNNKEDYQGTGMGLSIVQKIAQNHNGFVTAEGKKNQGALFNIYLPVDPNNA